MVKVLMSDLFRSQAQTIVNTVNCVGIMGKGIALEFKKRFPRMYEDYVARCEAKQVKLGQPYLFKNSADKWILNFPTKDHWRSVSRLSDIVEGLNYLEQHYKTWGITSLAVPALGCSNGQLEWRVVGKTLYRHLSRFDIPVELYAPFGTPQEQMELAFLSSEVSANASAVSDGQNNEKLKIDPAWVALVEILARIDREPFHWPIGRTSFQKIAYFATALGIPTGLHYQRGSYGPFAPELKPLITRLVNNGLIVEEQLGRMFSVRPGPTYQDAAKEFHPQLEKWQTLIDRITDLFLRMDTNQAEVAATVFFTARSLQGSVSNPSEEQIFEGVMQWKQKRRPPLKDEDVAKSVRNLNILRWFEAIPSNNLPLPKESMLDM
jgi:O-acetyl-ADP-ribose deacetylase (regulator of RNase III)/uncharacterized protein YwgA